MELARFMSPIENSPLSERSFGVRAARCRFFAGQLAGRNCRVREIEATISSALVVGFKIPQASLRERKRQQAARTPKLRSVLDEEPARLQVRAARKTNPN